jgi:hypothetical protein
MLEERPEQQRCAITLHPTFRDKLSKSLALFGQLPEHEQEMMLLIMHNWVIGGDHTERLYGVNRILLAYELRTMDDPRPIDAVMPDVRVHILGRALRELERA